MFSLFAALSGASLQRWQTRSECAASHAASSNLATLYGAERLRRCLFVLLLCDPVQRAQSAFYHFAKWGSSFKEYLHEQASRDAAAALQADEVMDASNYAPHLERWLEVTGRAAVVPAVAYYAAAASTTDAIVARFNHLSGRAVRRVQDGAAGEEPAGDGSRSATPGLRLSSDAPTRRKC